MRTQPKAIRKSTRRMIIHRMVMAIMIMITTITMMSIASMIISTAIPMLMTTSEPPTGDRNGLTKDEGAALYRLMTWLAPSFPVGAFSYSSGIEWAVEAGDIVDASSLRDWLGSMLADGTGFCDGVFLA